jgi:integrase
MGARTRNLHRASAVAFCNWAVATRRLTRSPLGQVKKADEALDPRRQRRALSEHELVRLLDVARGRPLLDAMTIRRGKRKGEAVARLREDTRRALEMLGRERALMDKTLVLSGLRKGELASLTVGQLDLDGDPPFLVLNAADAKNREASTIPLEADLAEDLRAWLGEKATALQDAAREPPGVLLTPRKPSGPEKQFWGLLGASLPASDQRTRLAGGYAAVHGAARPRADSRQGPPGRRDSEAR